MEMLEEISGADVVLVENCVDSRGDATVGENEYILVGVLLANHVEKILNTKLECEQGLFAVVRFDKAGIIVPDFTHRKRREFSVDGTEAAFYEAVINDDGGTIQHATGGDAGGLTGALEWGTVDCAKNELADGGVAVRGLDGAALV